MPDASMFRAIAIRIKAAIITLVSANARGPQTRQRMGRFQRKLQQQRQLGPHYRELSQQPWLQQEPSPQEGPIYRLAAAVRG